MYTYEFQIDEEACGSLRMAQAASAKKDVRYFLNGIYLDFRNGTVVGTDSHRLLEAPLVDEDTVCLYPQSRNDDSSDVPPSIIVSFEKKFPKGSDFAVLTLQTESVAGEQITDGKATLEFYRNRTRTTIVGEVIDGRYPDYKRVMPEHDRNGSLTDYTVNPLLISEVVQALGAGYAAVQMSFGGVNEPVLCKLAGAPRARLVVMPTRM